MHKFNRICSLQNLACAAVRKWLVTANSSHTLNIQETYRYLQHAAPFLSDIAEMCMYYNSGDLTRVFLPCLTSRGRLQITDSNALEILEYWKTKKCQHPLSCIKHFKIQLGTGVIERELYFSFPVLLGQMKNLQVLVIGGASMLNDTHMAVIGINCSQLQVFDARNDSENSFTETGLAYLCQCRKLKQVFFSSFADEFDLSDEQLEFSGKGVALLLSLPEIEEVVCSEYLLRDALHFFYQSRYNSQTLSLKRMFLCHPEVDDETLKILPILCPKLELVSLMVENNEEVIGKSLKSLMDLKILIIDVESSCKYQNISISHFGPQLVHLQITTYLLSIEDILLFSQSCSQLKFLMIKMCSYGFDISNMSTIKEPLFPSVEVLELSRSVSVALFTLLNTKMKNLKEVYLNKAKVYDFISALEKVIDGGGWQNLELISFPDSIRVPVQCVSLMASWLPKLRYVAISGTTNSKEDDWLQFIQGTFKGVKVIKFPNDWPIPSEIFLDVWRLSEANSFRRSYEDFSLNLSVPL